MGGTTGIPGYGMLPKTNNGILVKTKMQAVRSII